MAIDTLRNTEQTVMHIEFDFHGRPIVEAGVVPVVTVDVPAVLSATLRPDNLTIDIVTVDNAVGAARVTVTATLPDGVVLTNFQDFAVVMPEADAITLTVDGPVEKGSVAATAASTATVAASASVSAAVGSGGPIQP